LLFDDCCLLFVVCCLLFVVCCLLLCVLHTLQYKPRLCRHCLLTSYIVVIRHYLRPRAASYGIFSNALGNRFTDSQEFYPVKYLYNPIWVKNRILPVFSNHRMSTQSHLDSFSVFLNILLLIRFTYNFDAIYNSSFQQDL
jgi:hypothetical protein